MKSLDSVLATMAAGAMFLAISTQAILPESGLDDDTKMDVELKSFSNCENYPPVPMMFKELQVSQVAKKKFVVNGGVDMNMTITDDILAEITIMECQDSSSDDTCEFIALVRGSNFCEKISKEDTPWYKFVKDTDIGNKCPVVPGSYVFKESPLEFEDAEGVPLTPGHWKMRTELYSVTSENGVPTVDKEPFGCNVVEVSVSPSMG